MLAGSCSTVVELFRRRVEASGKHPMYRVKRGGSWEVTTWRQFGDRAEAIAAALHEWGLRRGDSVAIMGDTNPGWVEADMASLLLGARVVGVYQNLLLDQVQYLLEDAGCRLVFVQGRQALELVSPLLQTVETLEGVIAWGTEHETTLDGLASRALDPAPVREAQATLQPEDDVLVVYTSGTTGQPKGVPLNSRNILAMLFAGESLVDHVGPADITLSFLPMAHVAEHVPGFFGRMNLGLQTAYATNYDTVLDELQEIRPTIFGGVPRIFEKIYGRIHERVARASPRRQRLFVWAKALAVRKAREEMSLLDWLLYPVADVLVYRRLRAVFGGRVRGFLTGSAPINIEILEFFYGVGMVIIECYGMSECSAISFSNSAEDLRLGTVGRALPGVECRIASDGEIWLRGPAVFAGYLNQPGAARFDEEGWFPTGDIGDLDADGYLRITDRKKNLIKTAGGKYVAPARLEALIKEEPLVSQVYVHGDRRPYVVALVTLDERETGRVAEELGLSEAELPESPEVLRRISVAVERANARLARFEQLKAHAVLPRDFSLEEGTVTPTLKIKRRVVAERYADEIEALYLRGRGSAPG